MRLFQYGEASYSGAFPLLRSRPWYSRIKSDHVRHCPSTFIGVAHSHSQYMISENCISIPFRLRRLPSWTAVSVAASSPEVDCQRRSRALFGPETIGARLRSHASALASRNRWNITSAVPRSLSPGRFAKRSVWCPGTVSPSATAKCEYCRTVPTRCLEPSDHHGLRRRSTI